MYGLQHHMVHVLVSHFVGILCQRGYPVWGYPRIVPTDSSNSCNPVSPQTFDRTAWERLKHAVNLVPLLILASLGIQRHCY
jgi:hypothetical protein